MTSDSKWSIGIYSGESPFSLVPNKCNPVIDARQVNDLDADFVADPFMINHQDRWYLFFEILPRHVSSGPTQESLKGVIGLATSGDAVNWRYQGVVLAEPWHLSYPYVFDYNGSFYMLPETLGADCVTLYRARKFPHTWAPVANLINGQHADATPFFFQQRWWIFSCPTPEQHNSLMLHYADSLTGPWLPHALNPIIDQDIRTARPAGRVIRWQGRPLRFAQDCYPRYGTRVRAFEIVKLTPQYYAEQECTQSPILGPSGRGWNGRNMHHVDLHQLPNGRWLACADGYHHD